ncbi:MAG: hypothetical protein J2P13_05110 [Acidobacteria bacterium]|nr:hypothetical protein [Acidobacteriota bacterium]
MSSISLRVLRRSAARRQTGVPDTTVLAPFSLDQVCLRPALAERRPSVAGGVLYDVIYI